MKSNIGAVFEPERIKYHDLRHEVVVRGCQFTHQAAISTPNVLAVWYSYLAELKDSECATIAWQSVMRSWDLLGTHMEKSW